MRAKRSFAAELVHERQARHARGHRVSPRQPSHRWHSRAGSGRVDAIDGHDSGHHVDTISDPPWLDCSPNASHAALDAAAEPNGANHAADHYVAIKPGIVSRHDGNERGDGNRELDHGLSPDWRPGLAQFANQRVEIHGAFQDIPRTGDTAASSRVSNATRTLRINSVRALGGSCQAGGRQ